MTPRATSAVFIISLKNIIFCNKKNKKKYQILQKYVHLSKYPSFEGNFHFLP
jgi:hypothetical protein